MLQFSPGCAHLKVSSHESVPHLAALNTCVVTDRQFPPLNLEILSHISFLLCLASSGSCMEDPSISWAGWKCCVCSAMADFEHCPGPNGIHLFFRPEAYLPQCLVDVFSIGGSAID